MKQNQRLKHLKVTCLCRSSKIKLVKMTKSVYVLKKGKTPLYEFEKKFYSE